VREAVPEAPAGLVQSGGLPVDGPVPGKRPLVEPSTEEAFCRFDCAATRRGKTLGTFLAKVCLGALLAADIDRMRENGELAVDIAGRTAADERNPGHRPAGGRAQLGAELCSLANCQVSAALIMPRETF